MRTNNMTNNFIKHFYDPYDSLDVGWKLVIDKGYLSIAEAATLSGFSRQYLYKLQKRGVINSQPNEHGHSVIKWRHFVKWYSSLPSTPTSPIGYASLSLSELIRYTGMSRCWVLKFASRYNIPSYYVGRHRRFCKTTSIEVWNLERIKIKPWVTIEECITISELPPVNIYWAIAKSRIRVKHTGNVILYSRKDIMDLAKKEVEYV